MAKRNDDLIGVEIAMWQQRLKNWLEWDFCDKRSISVGISTARGAQACLDKIQKLLTERLAGVA